METGESNNCGEILNPNMALRSNLIIQTEEKPCDSAASGKSFTENKEDHQILKTGEESYRLGTCDNAGALDSHIKHDEIVHTVEKSYDCDVCGKTFTEKSSLKYHRKMHTEDRPYKCDTCGKDYRDQPWF